MSRAAKPYVRIRLTVDRNRLSGIATFILASKTVDGPEAFKQLMHKVSLSLSSFGDLRALPALGRDIEIGSRRFDLDCRVEHAKHPGLCRYLEQHPIEDKAYVLRRLLVDMSERLGGSPVALAAIPLVAGPVAAMGEAANGPEGPTPRAPLAEEATTALPTKSRHTAALAKIRPDDIRKAWASQA
ncbi:hypothetical protein [Piscinibacterium candidicorallinum]|uniref:Uncharacterized protein n=1 Tax=Piscinibacterium candidicorallinum TaxID=1793872 RepID=A0ABV7H3U4_9BURK